MYQHQATVTAAGELTYRDANLPMGYDGSDPHELANGDVYRFHGWTIMPTGHGMTVATD